MSCLRRSTTAAALLASALAPGLAAAAPDAPLPHAKPPAEPSAEAPPAGGEAPPAGGEAPPAGGEAPPAGGEAPPAEPPRDALSTEPPRDAPKDALVPPTPLTPLGADYPAGAHGDALVRLVLTVNADGTVRSAVAEEGQEPFASAAVAAATSFRFAPATRNGAPVAAKIRVEVRFTEAAPPVPPDASAPAAAPPPTPGGGPARAPAPPPGAPRSLEVTVHGEQQSPGVSSLSRGEVRIVPGAFGDPFRAIEMLPGVTPLVTGLPFFYVRGSPPGNVGYFLDGVRVPYLYHLGLGPSVVHPGIVDRVDLYPGGYPARHGRYAGGIVAGETTPPLPYWHGEGMLRLVDVGGLVEGPFAGGRGVALVGGRYSYTALLLSLAAPEVALDYWDYQARLSYEVVPEGRVSLFAFGAHDYLGDESDGETTTLFDTTFHRIDLRYDHAYGPGSALRGALTLGHDETGIEGGQKALTRSLGARVTLAHRLRDETVIRAGIDAVIDDNELDLGTDLDDPPGDVAPDDDDDDDVPVDDLLLSRVDFTTGGYIEADIAITPRLRITPGLRLDLYHSDGAVALGVDPRLSARLSLGRGVTFVQAHGLASQLPSFVVPIPGIRPRLDDGLQRSFQSSAGLEFALPEDIKATVSVFHNAFFNMTDALGSLGAGSFEDAFTLRALGAATGVELSAHRRLTKRIGGFASYTLSRSTRSIGRSRQVSSVDRTHVANAALTYDFGRGYRAGGRFVFYSGLPQRVGGVTFPPGSGVPGGLGPAAGAEPRWERLPPFFRLDVRLEKRWSIGKSGWLAVVLDVLNATMSKENMPGMCDAFEPCEPTEFGPVTVPSLGLEGGF
ncbi:TonB-dependent receptor domain-containing protein [Sorangium sp. So ce861]|uniref:TonB-dependent receptor plug domain-containing protein n=1 Tax=Sorangium sp. So ce861 TaxID=3133323 RepID=UPI003F639CAE